MRPRLPPHAVDAALARVRHRLMTTVRTPFVAGGEMYRIADPTSACDHQGRPLYTEPKVDVAPGRTPSEAKALLTQTLRAVRERGRLLGLTGIAGTGTNPEWAASILWQERIDWEQIDRIDAARAAAEAAAPQEAAAEAAAPQEAAAEAAAPQEAAAEDTPPDDPAETSEPSPA